jgi:hypothetical protein
MCFVVNLLTLTKLHTWWYTRGTCTAFTGVVHTCTLIHIIHFRVCIHIYLFTYIHNVPRYNMYVHMYVCSMYVRLDP